MRHFITRRVIFTYVFILLSVLVIDSGAQTRRSKLPAPSDGIKVTPTGPSEAQMNAVKERLLVDPNLRSAIKGSKNRLLEFSYIESDAKSPRAQHPPRVRAVYYDYTNDRTLVADGDFEGKEPVIVREEAYQPVPNTEEFDEAVAILRRDANLTAGFRENSIEIFRPMPPTSVLEGTTERLVNIGILNRTSAASNEVVSVSIKRGEVVRYAEKAPFTSRSAEHSCGVPGANQTPGNRGVAGQALLTVTRNAATLWEMTVIRPSASTGTTGSGIELRDVKYRGKSVLKRGHVPVLNVQYSGDVCGPYRDWQFSEDWFDAPAAGASNPAPGIRVLAAGQVATTVLETGIDTGNFQGVAIYTQNTDVGTETVLVTEMNAGWYRYIMEWRFADDGTIRPRFGFGGVENACVCEVHHHHAYWRFDFDIVSPLNKVYQVERGRKFLQPLTAEVNRNKSHQTRRSWLVQNAAGDEAYLLLPNMSDGNVDLFGRNDLWLLRYKNVPGGTAVQNELDDGPASFGSRLPCTDTGGSCINIHPFVNGESTTGQDVVVWYGAHYTHDEQHSHLLNANRSGEVISGSHVVGPNLRPVRW